MVLFPQQRVLHLHILCRTVWTHFGHCSIGPIARSELHLFIDVLGSIEVLLIFIARRGLDLQQIFESGPDRDTSVAADSRLLSIWRDCRSISLG